MSERGYEGDESKKKKKKQGGGGSRRGGDRYGGDDIDRALEELDEAVARQGGLPKPAEKKAEAGGKPVAAAVPEVKPGSATPEVETAQAQVVKSEPMKAELAGTTLTPPEAQTEQLSEQEKARRKYYDEQLFDDLMVAVKRVDNASPKAKEAYEARDKARGRLKAAGLDMEEIVKRKQFRNEPEDQYREYARRVRDNVDLIDTVTDFLSHPERILRKQQQTEYYVDFLVGLGVNSGSIKAVIENNVRAYTEQQAQAAAPEVTPAGGDIETPKQQGETERKKRELNEAEKVIESQSLEYWLDNVIKYGVDDEEDSLLIQKFVESENNSLEWVALRRLLDEMAKLDPKLTRIVEGLDVKLLSSADDSQREDWSKRRKANVKLALIKAKKFIFNYWSTDDYDGRNVIAEVYKEIGSVKDLRSRHVDVMGVQKDLRVMLQYVNNATEYVVGKKLVGFKLDRDRSILLVENYRKWATEKIGAMGRQVAGGWKDDDPRLWNDETESEEITLRVRQDILFRERSAQRAGGTPWTEVTDYFDQGIHYRILDCVDDEILRDELSREMEARDFLDNYFRGYDRERKSVRGMLDYVKSNMALMEISRVILPIAEAREGLSRAVSLALAEYIRIGEESFYKYYHEELRVYKEGDENGEKRGPIVKGGRNELRKVIFRMKQKGASAAELEPYEDTIKRSRKEDKNFFSVRKSDELVERTRRSITVRVRERLGDQYGKDLRNQDAEQAELLALRLMYVLGIAGKYNYDQDSTNNDRDDLGSLVRMNEKWLVAKEASVTPPTPLIISGPRLSEIGDQPFARLAGTESWLEMITEVKLPSSEIPEDPKIKETLDRADSVRDARRTKRYAEPGQGNDLVDYLRTEITSNAYLAIRAGKFDQLNWSDGTSEIGKFQAYAKAGLDIRDALEKPGVEPKEATLNELGMSWLRDRAALAFLMLRDDKKPQSEYELFLDRILYRWAISILDSHDPRVRGVQKGQIWSDEQIVQFIDDIQASKLVKDSGLIEKIKTNYGYGTRFGHLLQSIGVGAGRITKSGK